VTALLPTPGDWIALAVWLLVVGTIAGILLGQELERRREANRLKGPIDAFAELRSILRPGAPAAPTRVVMPPEQLERIRRTFPDARTVGTWGGVPIVVSNHLERDQVVVVRDLDFEPPPRTFFADDTPWRRPDEPYDGTFLGSTS
jgi:hypothetical protein